jgi:membrane protein DedA with SNARE-associated domain
VTGEADLLLNAGGWAYLVIFVVIFSVGIPFVGVFVPAQLFLLGAGFLAQLGELGLVRVLVAAFVASFLGDLLAYSLGRRYGVHVFDRLPSALHRHVATLQRSLAVHLGKSMVAGRWLGGARALTAPLAGSARVPWRRFLGWNVAASAIWSVGVVALGYFFAAGFARIQGRVGQGALVLVLVAIAVYLGVQRYRAARREDRDIRERAEGPP